MGVLKSIILYTHDEKRFIIIWLIGILTQ